MRTQPAREQGLRGHNDVGPRLDIFAVGAVLAGFLAAFPEFGIEAQTIERAEALVALVKGFDVEPGGAKTLAAGIAQDRGHLRLQIGERGLLGLLRGIVEFSGVVEGRELCDRRIARRDVAVFRRRRRGTCHGNRRDGHRGGDQSDNDG